MNKILKIGLGLQLCQWSILLLVALAWLLSKLSITKDVLSVIVLSTLFIGFNVFSLVLIIKGLNQDDSHYDDY